MTLARLGYEEELGQAMLGEFEARRAELLSSDGRLSARNESAGGTGGNCPAVLTKRATSAAMSVLRGTEEVRVQEFEQVLHRQVEVVKSEARFLREQVEAVEGRFSQG